MRDSLGGHVTDADRSLTLGQAFLVYIATLAMAVGGAFVLQRWFALDVRRGALFFLSAIYLAAAARRPWPLYWTLRNMRIFNSIDDDKDAIRLMVVVSVALLTAAILWHPH